MPDNSQKTALARTLNQFAGRAIQGAMEQLGRQLPAKVVSRQGAIVTASFLVTSPYTLPNVTVPLIGSEYVRLPIQPGCLGWVMSADTYLGGVSGLGGGTASLTPWGNLSMLVFSPIGNKNWSASDDDNAVVIYGPDGVILRDSQSRIKMKLQPSAAEIDLPSGVPLKINGGLTVTLSGNNIVFSGLPTSPGASGVVYNSGGTLKVSP